MSNVKKLIVITNLCELESGEQGQPTAHKYSFGYTVWGFVVIKKKKKKNHDHVSRKP